MDKPLAVSSARIASAAEATRGIQPALEDVARTRSRGPTVPCAVSQHKYVDSNADYLVLGAHLVASRCGYTHHGIYVGDGRVVHYAGSCRFLVRGPVEEVTVAEFADGGWIGMRVPLTSFFSPEFVVARARSRLGENRYSIARNNCEHFCTWCRYGASSSEQVERLLTLPRGAARIARDLLARMLRLSNARPGARSS